MSNAKKWRGYNYAGPVNPQAAAVSKKRNEPFLLETGKAAAGRRVGAVPAVGAAHGIASK